MIIFSVINPILLNTIFADYLLVEEHIPEIYFANLTDWGWVVFFSVVILVVWVLIIFQVKSKGSHPYGMVSDPDNIHDNEDH